MRKKSQYRLFIWLMIFSGCLLTLTLGVISLKIIQAGDRFTQNVLNEHRFFLKNTIRFAHDTMMHSGLNNYQKLIELALECQSINYFGIFDREGVMLSQSRPPDGLAWLRKAKIPDLQDGKLIEKSKTNILVALNADGALSKQQQMGHMMSAPGESKSINPAWFLVGIDTTIYQKHFSNMLIQISVSTTVLLLLGTLIIVFFGIIQRYELAHLSIEKLNKAKKLLGHFVPKFAKEMIEQQPDKKGLLDKYLEDASVLFLDIEDFTLLSNQHSQAKINRAIETYFSDFLDLITKNNGDINETAGDGMMVIFKASDPAQHPQNAIRTALQIRKHCLEVSKEGDSDLFPIRVNIGIQSGKVYLGSTKIRGIESERWTYTASGAVTNMAARLAQYATKGQIIVGDDTARRIDQEFSLAPLGKVPLKNIPDSGYIHEVSG